MKALTLVVSFTVLATDCIPLLSPSVVCSLVAIPVYVKHNITFREGSSQGRFELTLGPKQTMGKAVESVLVNSQLPRGVLNVNFNPSQGTYTFDPVTKVSTLRASFLCLCTWCKPAYSATMWAGLE